MPSAPRIGPCVHCARRVFLRPRRLCCACYKDAAVRALHPTVAKAAPDNRARPPAPEPTRAQPGTRAKLAALAARAEAGVALYHPADAATLDGARAAELLAPQREPALREYAGPKCSRCRQPWDRRDGRQTCPGCRADLLARYHGRKGSRKRGGVA